MAQRTARSMKASINENISEIGFHTICGDRMIVHPFVANRQVLGLIQIDGGQIDRDGFLKLSERFIFGNHVLCLDACEFGCPNYLN